MALWPKGGAPSNIFLSFLRNLHELFLLYWVTPRITPGTAWLARVGVESRINKTNNNNQIRVSVGVKCLPFTD